MSANSRLAKAKELSCSSQATSMIFETVLENLTWCFQSGFLICGASRLGRANWDDQNAECAYFQSLDCVTLSM